MRLGNRSLATIAVGVLAVTTACGSGGSGDATDATDIDAFGLDDVTTPASTDSNVTTPTDTATTDTSAATSDPDPAEAGSPNDTAEAAAAEPAAAEPAAAEPAAPAPGVIAVSLTADERTAADSPVAQAITSAFPPGFAPPSEEQARCVGGKIVNAVGTDRLAELGITADSIDIFGATDFTPDEVDAMVDILFECVDVQFMVASMFAPSAGPETAECFADFVDEQLIRDLAAPFLGGGAIDADFFLEQVGAANQACLPVDG